MGGREWWICGKGKREVNKNSQKKYIKRENFGYLLEIARGVWVFKTSNEKEWAYNFRQVAKRTQLFRFSLSWQQGRVGDKKDSFWYTFWGRILKIKSRNVFAQVIGVGGWIKFVQRLSSSSCAILYLGF